jgi:hypothetical protein
MGLDAAAATMTKPIPSPTLPLKGREYGLLPFEVATLSSPFQVAPHSSPPFKGGAGGGMGLDAAATMTKPIPTPTLPLKGREYGPLPIGKGYETVNPMQEHIP